MALFQDETKQRLSRLEHGMGLIAGLFAAMGGFYRIGIYYKEKLPTLAFIDTKSYNPKTGTANLMSFHHVWSSGVYHAWEVEEWVHNPAKDEEDQEPKDNRFIFVGEDFASDLLKLFHEEPKAEAEDESVARPAA